MNDSPVRRCLPVLALAVAASVAISVAISVAAAPVLAQKKGPRPLTPTTLAPPPAADPVPATNRNDPPRPGAAAADGTPPPARIPGQPPGRMSDPATTQPGGPAPVRIEVDQLRRISPDSVGTLTAGEGGFGIDMWTGTGRRVIETLLPRLPVRTTSRAMRDLMRRLLLSTATAPPGGENAGRLVAMRLDALAALGDVAGTDALIKAAPSRGISEDLLRAEADLLFVTNDNARACPLVAGQIKDDVSTYWQKAFIFCQSLAGEHAKASLGVSLLREEGEEDPVFFGLIDRLSGVEKFEIESLSQPGAAAFRHGPGVARPVAAGRDFIRQPVGPAHRRDQPQCPARTPHRCRRTGGKHRRAPDRCAAAALCRRHILRGCPRQSADPGRGRPLAAQPRAPVPEGAGRKRAHRPRRGAEPGLRAGPRGGPVHGRGAGLFGDSRQLEPDTGFGVVRAERGAGGHCRE